MPANRLPHEIDTDKLAEAALAILSLTIHDDGRVWKGLDWDLMDLLHEKGWIVDPQTKAKSVVLTKTANGSQPSSCVSTLGAAPPRVAPSGRDALTSCSPDPESLAIMEIRP